MKELFADTWVQMDRGVRIFLLAGKERALVIDTGMTGLDIRAMAAAQTDLPFELLNTHADRDHIASNAQFPSFYMHPAEAAFYHNVQRGRGEDRVEPGEAEKTDFLRSIKKKKRVRLHESIPKA